jgi:hypothetical protein
MTDVPPVSSCGLSKRHSFAGDQLSVLVVQPA